MQHLSVWKGLWEGEKERERATSHNATHKPNGPPINQKKKLQPEKWKI